MYVQSSKGTLYGHCPAKVMRDDPETVAAFNVLVVIAETGQLLVSGGITAQPDWLIDELAWFLPRYRSYQFARQAGMLFGSDDAKPTPGGSQPPAKSRSRRTQKGG